MMGWRKKKKALHQLSGDVKHENLVLNEARVKYLCKIVMKEAFWAIPLR